MAAGRVDVLDVILVTLVADRTETLLQHHFGEAQNGVQGRADLVADLGEKIRFRSACGFGGLARGDQAPFGVALTAEVANERAKFGRFARTDARQRQRQRDRSAAAIAPDHLEWTIDRFGFAALT